MRLLIRTSLETLEWIFCCFIFQVLSPAWLLDAGYWVLQRLQQGIKYACPTHKGGTRSFPALACPRGALTNTSRSDIDSPGKEARKRHLQKAPAQMLLAAAGGKVRAQRWQESSMGKGKRCGDGAAGWALSSGALCPQPRHAGALGSALPLSTLSLRPRATGL